MIRMRSFALATAAVALLPPLAGCHGPVPASQRPAAWAQPVACGCLPNFHKVDDGLYRGAQPDPDGWRELASRGVRTVINVRGEGSPPDPIADGMACVAIPMSPWSVSDDQVIRFLRIAADPGRRPVFVHCKNGADRTGVLCAMYRVAVQGWTRRQAVDEMTGNGMGFHNACQCMIDYVNAADVDRIRAAAGIKIPSKAISALAPPSPP